MSKFLLNRTFFEHECYKIEDIDIDEIYFKNNMESKCIEITKNNSETHIKCSYYIGVDWLLDNKLAIQISPKLNNVNEQINYFEMLFTCLKHPEIAKYTKDIYEIKFEQAPIIIEDKQDLLTPILIIQFLQLLKHIVKKGLKKTYYRIENNLTSKIKGRILVSRTLKNNPSQNNLNKIYCNYQEFGYNNLENRLLKHILLFCQKYLNLYPYYTKTAQPIINFCIPAFNEVDDFVDLKCIKRVPLNSFYPEYKEAIYSAILILKRFAYNLKDQKIDNVRITKTPPFWIDMAKLFELYVLSILNEQYGDEITFQFKGHYGQPDFLLTNKKNKAILDAKYKPIYAGDNYDIDDIKQLSGYARDKKILAKLGCKVSDEQINIIDCIIIYPDQSSYESLPLNLKNQAVRHFSQFYKIPIRLPTINI